MKRKPKENKEEDRVQVGDIVTYKGTEYKVIQLFFYGLAIIENEEKRICVQYEDLKK